MTYLWIFLGGGLGSVLRFGVSNWMIRQPGPEFPWGTLLVNVSGSLFIGYLSAFTNPDTHWLGSSTARQFLMAGVCGGYTTFSAFSLQTLGLIQEGDWPKAGLNVVVSVSLCLAAVAMGHWLGNALHPASG